VLVVEDDCWIRDVLEMALESAGYNVVVADDGLDALDKLDAPRPDLILLDLMMPNVNGFEFAEQLRYRGLRPGTPLIVLTAADRAQQKAAAIGAEACIQKPFGLSPLLAEVSRLIGAPALA
jgi:DNA-binding response OmpR family regulator